MTIQDLFRILLNEEEIEIELKNEIVTCKTEEDFKNCINKIYEHIKYISCEK